MPTDGKTNDGQNRLYALSTDALENMLHDAFISGNDSVESLKLMDSIIAELDRRKADEPSMSAEESYKEFMADYANKDSLYLDCAADSTITEKATVTRRRHRLSTVAKSALIAAALVIAVLASMIAAQAAGVDVFGSIARWTADMFGFGYSQTDEKGSTDDGTSKEIPPQLEALRNALAEYGLPTEYVPTYWPEGYGKPEINVNNNHIMTYVSCNFPESTSGAMISFSTSNPEKDFDYSQYCKDDITPIVLKGSELTFYVMANVDSFFAVCNNGSIEISVFGITERNDLVKIIESIGVQK